MISRSSTAVALIATLASISPWWVDAARAGDPCPRAVAHDAAPADRRTTLEVERRIATDETIAPRATRVTVTTAAGVVTLAGVVASDEDRMVLASLAESAPGVRRVEDRLEVKPWPARPSASRAR